MGSHTKIIGVVYVATNIVISHYAKTEAGIDAVCKIGMSRIGLDALYGRDNAHQNPFARNEFVFSLETKKPELVEREAHRLLREKRINNGAGTEWFSCDIGEAIKVVKKANRVVSRSWFNPQSEDADEWLAAIGERLGVVVDFNHPSMPKRKKKELTPIVRHKQRTKPCNPQRFENVQLGRGWK